MSVAFVCLRRCVCVFRRRNKKGQDVQMEDVQNGHSKWSVATVTVVKKSGEARVGVTLCRTLSCPGFEFAINTSKGSHSSRLTPVTTEGRKGCKCCRAGGESSSQERSKCGTMCVCVSFPESRQRFAYMWVPRVLHVRGACHRHDCCYLWIAGCGMKTSP